LCPFWAYYKILRTFATPFDGGGDDDDMIHKGAFPHDI